MENLLTSKKYWQVVIDGIQEPIPDEVLSDARKTELENLRLKDLKAKNYIFPAIGRSNLETILKKDNLKDI